MSPTMAIPMFHGGADRASFVHGMSFSVVNVSGQVAFRFPLKISLVFHGGGNGTPPVYGMPFWTVKVSGRVVSRFPLKISSFSSSAHTFTFPQS